MKITESTDRFHLELVQRLTNAARPYMIEAEARELAVNVAGYEATMTSTAFEVAVRDAIRHRIGNGWASCGDVLSCAAAMARTWSRAQACRRAGADISAMGDAKRPIGPICLCLHSRYEHRPGEGVGDYGGRCGVRGCKCEVYVRRAPTLCGRSVPGIYGGSDGPLGPWETLA